MSINKESGSVLLRKMLATRLSNIITEARLVDIYPAPRFASKRASPVGDPTQSESSDDDEDGEEDEEHDGSLSDADSFHSAGSSSVSRDTRDGDVVVTQQRTRRGPAWMRSGEFDLR